jgi:hypothetical protein
MAPKVELEERLRRLGAAYDDVVPQTPAVQRRVMARIALAVTPEARKPTLGREFVLAGALILFVAAVAIGLNTVRSSRQPVRGLAPASPTPVSASPSPRAQIPLADLAAAGLTVDQVTPLEIAATDRGRTVTLLGGYADPARMVLIFHADGVALQRTTTMVDDGQGMVNGSSSGSRPPSTGDSIYIVDAGPHPGSDGLAHLTIGLTSWRAGNGPGQVDGQWAFSLSLHVQAATALAAPQQFPLGRWKGTIEILELTPTVVHLQAVITGASVMEIGLSTVTLLDPDGNVVGQGCGAGITVPKTQISSPNSPLYHNARVYCEFTRPSSSGLYRIRFQGGGGSYLIPVSIHALAPTRTAR